MRSLEHVRLPGRVSPRDQKALEMLREGQKRAIALSKAERQAELAARQPLPRAEKRVEPPKTSFRARMEQRVSGVVGKVRGLFAKQAAPAVSELPVETKVRPTGTMATAQAKLVDARQVWASRSGSLETNIQRLPKAERKQAVSYLSGGMSLESQRITDSIADVKEKLRFPGITAERTAELNAKMEGLKHEQQVAGAVHGWLRDAAKGGGVDGLKGLSADDRKLAADMLTASLRHGKKYLQSELDDIYQQQKEGGLSERKQWSLIRQTNEIAAAQRTMELVDTWMTQSGQAQANLDAIAAWEDKLRQPDGMRWAAAIVAPSSKASLNGRADPWRSLAPSTRPAPQPVPTKVTTFDQAKDYVGRIEAAMKADLDWLKTERTAYLNADVTKQVREARDFHAVLSATRDAITAEKKAGLIAADAYGSVDVPQAGEDNFLAKLGEKHGKMMANLTNNIQRREAMLVDIDEMRYKLGKMDDPHKQAKLVKAVSKLAERFDDPENAAFSYANAMEDRDPNHGFNKWQRMNNPEGFEATWFAVEVASGIAQADHVRNSGVQGGQYTPQGAS
jgi:hypothetical protein